MPDPINATIARLIRQANAASDTSNHAEAQQLARTAVEKAEANGHQPTRTAAHYTLAAALWADETASAEEARQHAVTAFDLAKTNSEEYFLALTILARIDAALGNVVSAQALNERLLDIYQRKNRKAGIAEVRRSLGDLALKQQNYIAARAHFEQSLAYYQGNQNGDVRNYAGLLLSMGTLEYLEQRFAAARQCWQRARVLGLDNSLQQVVDAADQGLDALSDVDEVENPI